MDRKAAVENVPFLPLIVALRPRSAHFGTGICPALALMDSESADSAGSRHVSGVSEREPAQ